MVKFFSLFSSLSVVRERRLLYILIILCSLLRPIPAPFHKDRLTKQLYNSNRKLERGYIDKVKQRNIRDTDHCIKHNCLNGATCVDGDNGFTCSCAPGYNGVRCHMEIDECESNPCQNRGNCIDKINGFVCRCGGGFTGTHCEKAPKKKVASLKKKITSTKKEDASPKKEVAAAKTTKKLVTGGNPCFMHGIVPCRRGGSCQRVGDNDYKCLCTQHFTGKNCETVMPYCKKDTCKNGAVCHETRMKFVCKCPVGFVGEYCETNIDDCVHHTCKNKATCVDGINSYNCTCVAGYGGVHCQTEIDECASKPCQHRANCIDKINGYECRCIKGYEGKHCETELDYCSGEPCENGATCVHSVGNYTCKCVTGYTGRNCQTNIDDCASRPCLNKATCTDLVNGYACNCQSGFRGETCAIDVNECESDPCQNGATCADLAGRYKCRCVAGYTGVNCEKEIDECALASQCNSHGKCVDLLNSFRCECNADYRGDFCEKRICKPEEWTTWSGCKGFCEADAVETRTRALFSTGDYYDRCLEKYPTQQKRKCNGKGCPKHEPNLNVTEKPKIDGFQYVSDGKICLERDRAVLDHAVKLYDCSKNCLDDIACRGFTYNSTGQKDSQGTCIMFKTWCLQFNSQIGKIVSYKKLEPAGFYCGQSKCNIKPDRVGSQYFFHGETEVVMRHVLAYIDFMPHHHNCPKACLNTLGCRSYIVSPLHVGVNQINCTLTNLETCNMPGLQPLTGDLSSHQWRFCQRVPSCTSE